LNPNRNTYGSLIFQAITAGLLALMMILPAEQLRAAHCPMDMEARKQQTGNTCCPGSGERQDGSSDQDEQNRQNDHCNHSGDDGTDSCLSCAECTCAFVPYSGDNSLFDREAAHIQVQADVSAPSQAISYTVEETIQAPAPPGKPIHKPVPIYLSNQVFLN